MAGIRIILFLYVALLQCVAGLPRFEKWTHAKSLPLIPWVQRCIRTPQSTGIIHAYHSKGRAQYKPLSENKDHALVQSPEHLGGAAGITLQLGSFLHRTNVALGQYEIEYKIILENRGKSIHSAQLAWFAEKDSSLPEYLFTIEAGAGHSTEGCIILPVHSATKCITYTAF